MAPANTEALYDLGSFESLSEENQGKWDKFIKDIQEGMGKDSEDKDVRERFLNAPFVRGHQRRGLVMESVYCEILRPEEDILWRQIFKVNKVDNLPVGFSNLCNAGIALDLNGPFPVIENEEDLWSYFDEKKEQGLQMINTNQGMMLLVEKDLQPDSDMYTLLDKKWSSAS